MTKDTVMTWLRQNGWKQDGYGHYQRVLTPERTDGNTTVVYRMKFQDKTLRYEKQICIAGKNEWLRLSSGFYSALSVVNGQLKGMKR